MLAAINGHTEIIPMLITAGSTGVRVLPKLIHIGHLSHCNPLLLAIMHCHEPAARLLAEHPQALVDGLHVYGTNPLSLAAFCRMPSVVETLLRRGAKSHRGDVSLCHATPLDMAVLSEDNEEVINMLIRDAKSHDNFEYLGNRALVQAFDCKYGANALLLMRQGAWVPRIEYHWMARFSSDKGDWASEGEWEENALRKASQSDGLLPVTKYLIGKLAYAKGDASITEKVLQDALVHSIIAGWAPRTVEYLVKHDEIRSVPFRTHKSYHLFDDLGNPFCNTTYLHLAMYQKPLCAEVLEALINAEICGLEERDNFNNTVLWYALLKDDREVAAFLLHHGANPDHCSPFIWKQGDWQYDVINKTSRLIPKI
ncbi:ankyrin repeat-containing domain protein [Xylariaceae sp. FL0662B]|nr:ankyrin repeat-containing domain protein [Xylariaceae sp. FL0662B]